MFRKTLVRMFEDQDLDCVFMETHMNPRRKLHMVLECIPLPRELGDMAPIYFKVWMTYLRIYKAQVPTALRGGYGMSVGEKYLYYELEL